MNSPMNNFEDYEIKEDGLLDSYEEDSDDDDSENDEPRRALAFDPSQLSNSTDLPVNGHDFLKMVQEERKNLPDIVTVPKKFVPPSNPNNELISQPSTKAPQLVLDDEGKAFSDLFNKVLGPDDEKTEALNSSQTNSYPDSETTSSEEPDISVLNADESQLSVESIREMKKQIRLKSLGCTPLRIPKNQSHLGQVDQHTTHPCAKELVHREQILENFLNLRSKIEGLRGQALAGPSEHPSGDGDVDDDDDDDQDHHDIDRENIKKSKKSLDKALARSRRRANMLIRLMNLGQPPQVGELMHKSQLDIHLTLERLADQCESAPIYSTLHADWIYSLMSMLREPIEPDICSTLRRLAKVCMARRDAYEKRCTASVAGGNGACSGSHDNDESRRQLVNAVDKEEYYACLLIICIVRCHFGQADLK